MASEVHIRNTKQVIRMCYFYRHKSYQAFFSAFLAEMFRCFNLWKQYECSIELILQKYKHALVETLHLDSAFAISFSNQNQLKHHKWKFICISNTSTKPRIHYSENNTLGCLQQLIKLRFIVSQWGPEGCTKWAPHSISRVTIHGYTVSLDYLIRS